MGDKIKKVKELQEEKKLLKTEIKSLKKKIPYFIVGFIFFSIGCALTFEGKFNELFGDSYNLILSIVVLLVLTSITYIIIIALKVKNKKSQIKTIGLQLYNMMKLKSEF